MLPTVCLRWIGLFLLLILSKVHLLAQAKALPPPELITDRQGLPQGFVPGVVQDQQGFIWMATYDGLCRYDGTRFKVFQADPSSPSPLSFSNIVALQLDHRGRIWLLSEQGELVVFNPRTEQFTNVTRQALIRLPFAQATVRHVYPDRQNRLWLILASKGLVCYDLTTRQYQWFRHQADDPHSLSSDSLNCVLQDRQGTLWVGTADAGLDRFDEHSARFVHYRPGSSTPLALPELNVFSLYQQPSGELLLGTIHYLCQLDPKIGQLRTYRLPEGNLRWGNHYLWGMRFATDSRGSVYFDQRDRLFRFTNQQGPQLLARLTPQTGFSTSLFIDRSDVLWIGTDGSGVRRYDLRADGFQVTRYQAGFQTDLFTHWLRLPESQLIATRSNNPYMFRYTVDRQGLLWANLGSSVFYRINPATQQVHRVDFPVRFSSAISPFTTDPRGQVWVLYSNTLWYRDTIRQQWVRSAYAIDYRQTGEIMQLVADQDAFWLMTRQQGLFRLDHSTGHLRHYKLHTKGAVSPGNPLLLCLSADPDDTNLLWIGTSGSGLCLFDKRSGQSRWITRRQGLPNQVVYSAIADRQGYLWLGTNKGLVRLHRKQLDLRVYTTQDGLLANEFNRYHSLYLPGRGTAGPVRRVSDHAGSTLGAPAIRSDETNDDQILMGGVEGITAFQPARLREDMFQPKVELTSLSINNQEVNPAAQSVLSRPIQATDQLRLRYDQNFLTIQFAALQYNRPGKNRYRYRLEGLDPAWVETAQPQALYTALAPGRYTLLVNASNTSGQWSPSVRRLTVVISPPLWATWWAYVLYGLVVTGSVWYGFRLRLNRLQLQQAVAMRQQEARQLQALDTMKTRFFTNITHDFRTPLTLILSPMSGLLQELAGTRHQQRLESIRRNAQQLLALINQLLDFARLDARALAVQETRGDLNQFVEHLLSLFRDEAAGKGIALVYGSSVTGEYWFDAEKLERITMNLLGNALKFTPAGGQISITLETAQVIELIVLDTGVGIPSEKRPFIFDRFFQVDAHQDGLQAGTASNPMGTGIGLALVKELVQLQGGTIEVESQPGQGTTFRVSLPYRRVDEASSVASPVEPFTAPPPVTILPESESAGEPPHLLLVEDNAELADFIADSLPAHYRISRAANGAQGLLQALEQQPDLVISDVMMPIMDGYTLCQNLKDDQRTDHIPVILLTAKAAFESRLEGLGRGADDYLTKPFHVQELTLRVHNLLERQRRYRDRMRQELTRLVPAGLDHPNESSSTRSVPIPLDPFLEKLYAKVEEKLDDTSLGVEQLADQLNLSRSSLHRKVKALTGLATGDVVRIYRLKRATQFLQQGYNSSETAYRVGFDSPQYFAKCFRDQYQMTPSEFARPA